MKKDLVVFIAHIDDFECSCYGYVFKHHKEYNKIKIITATTWDKKLMKKIKQKFSWDQAKDVATSDFLAHEVFELDSYEHIYSVQEGDVVLD